MDVGSVFSRIPVMKDPLRSLFYKTLNGVATAPELKAKASEKESDLVSQ